jgi:hypothetical protein
LFGLWLGAALAAGEKSPYSSNTYMWDAIKKPQRYAILFFGKVRNPP